MKTFFLRFLIDVCAGLLMLWSLVAIPFPISFFVFLAEFFILMRETKVLGVPWKFRKAVRCVYKFEKELRNSNGKCVKMKKIKTRVSIYIFRDRYNQTERVVCYHLDGCAPAQKKYFMEFSHQLHMILAKTFPFHWDIQETVDSNLVPTIQ